ncbi:MAG: NAD-dependent epimerase/dehydratase family protein [Fimbriimonadaceae bacterium]|nr:NAD-dependent epimerase/dehydratase family protein [Fimbriimonadaceae bacterium]
MKILGNTVAENQFWDEAKSNGLIVVTGGAGFIGGRLIPALISHFPNHRIVSVDNYFTGSKDNHHQDQRLMYLDAATMDGLDFLPVAPKYVFHLGEFSRIVRSFPDIEYCAQFNQTGTFKVVDYCRRNGSKLIYAGSSSKFGNEGKDEHLSPYAWMKAKNIELIHNMKDWFGLDFAITYFYNVYGPGQILTGNYAAVIGLFEEKVKQGLPLTVVTPGTQKRDFTHVDDIVRGLVLAAEKGDGDNYLLGSGENWTILEVVEMFDHPYEFIPERTGERFTSLAYESRAQAELGWSPQIRLPEYIKAWKAEWLKSQGSN